MAIGHSGSEISSRKIINRLMYIHIIYTGPTTLCECVCVQFTQAPATYSHLRLRLHHRGAVKCYCPGRHRCALIFFLSSYCVCCALAAAAEQFLALVRRVAPISLARYILALSFAWTIRARKRVYISLSVFFARTFTRRDSWVYIYTSNESPAVRLSLSRELIFSLSL